MGLVTGGCLAGLGHEVICTDSDAEKLKTLESGRLPIYEPGLDTVIAEARKKSRLSFQSQYSRDSPKERSDFHLRGHAATAQWQRGPERHRSRGARW